MKNPDEFYFAMHRNKTKEGVHVLDSTDKSLNHDVIKVWDWDAPALEWTACVMCALHAEHAHNWWTSR